MNKRIIGLDILRDIGVIFIFCYHFTVEYIITAGGTEGYMYGLNYFFNILARPASLFLFVISGYALMYNHEDSLPVLKFYKRRVKGLFIPFYVAYTVMFIACFVVNNQSNLNGIPLWHFIFTLLGLDGVMQLKIPVFYLIGEWFMTCIVVCYALFPLLARLLKKAAWLTMGLLAVWYFVLLFFFNPFGFSQLMNPLFIIVYFYMGMLMQKTLTTHEIKGWLTIACALISVAGFVFYYLCGFNASFAAIRPSNEVSEVITIIWSMAMIIALMKVEIAPEKKIYNAITYVSGISWYIILLHHRIMILFYSNYSVEAYTRRDMFALFLSCFFITWLVAIFVRNMAKRIQAAMK